MVLIGWSQVCRNQCCRRAIYCAKFLDWRHWKGHFPAHTDFEELFTWFYFKEDEELREQKERRDFGCQLKEMSAVRQAISSMFPEVS